MSRTKKIVIMSALVLLLAVTAVFNFVLAGRGTGRADGDDATTVANYFSTYRTDRTTNRNAELLELDSILAEVDSSSTEYAEAIALKLDIVEAMEKELLLETYIKAMGYEDVVVSIGTESENVNVFVSASALAYEDFLAIYNILSTEAGCDPANVNITPIGTEI